jgi:hypothetical protein
MNTPEIPTPEAGETSTPGNEIPSQMLAFASGAPAVTADVAESPEGAGAGVKVSICSTPPGVSQHRAFPSFMRRYIDMAGASGPEMGQPRPLPQAHLVPRALREDGALTPPITPSQPPVTASVTGEAPAPGSICPTCRSRVPARLSAAERQRAYRERKREQGKSNEAEGDNGI